jgi:hypothetical protein
MTILVLESELSTDTVVSAGGGRVVQFLGVNSNTEGSLDTRAISMECVYQHYN